MIIHRRRKYTRKKKQLIEIINRLIRRNRRKHTGLRRTQKHKKNNKTNKNQKQKNNQKNNKKLK